MLQQTFHAGNNRGSQVLPSVCPAHLGPAFLFCMCYFKLEHNASIFRLLLNACYRTENSVILSGGAEQYSTDETSPAARLPPSLGCGIYFWLYDEREPVAVVQACSPGHPTSQKPFAVLPLLGDTSKSPFGSRDHSAALLVFKFPEMGCFGSWLELAGWESQCALLEPHLCFFLVTLKNFSPPSLI